MLTLLKLLLGLLPLSLAAQEPIIIGICQIAEHPALDEERQGLITALAAAGYIAGKNIRIVYENAQGNLATAGQIAQKLVSQKPKVIVAIATPMAQVIKPLANKHQIPVVFTAVTDPVAAKLIKKLPHSEGCITGISDRLPLAPQLELIRKLCPLARKIGVLYNPGEINSVTAVTQLKQLAKDYDFQIVEATATKTADVSTATQKLTSEAEVIFVPNDNTAVAAIRTIVGQAHKLAIPVFAGDSGSIANGAVAGMVYDRQKLGGEVGQIVLKIIDNQPVNTIPVQSTHPLTLMINDKAAKYLQLIIPEGLEKK